MVGLSGVGSHDLISPGLSLQIAWYLDISDGLYLDNSAAGLVKSYLRLPGTWYLDISAANLIRSDCLVLGILISVSTAGLISSNLRWPGTWLEEHARTGLTTLTGDRPEMEISVTIKKKDLEVDLEPSHAEEGEECERHKVEQGWLGSLEHLRHSNLPQNSCLKIQS